MCANGEQPPRESHGGREVTTLHEHAKGPTAFRRTALDMRRRLPATRHDVAGHGQVLPAHAERVAGGVAHGLQRMQRRGGLVLLVLVWGCDTPRGASPQTPRWAAHTRMSTRGVAVRSRVVVRRRPGSFSDCGRPRPPGTPRQHGHGRDLFVRNVFGRRAIARKRCPLSPLAKGERDRVRGLGRGVWMPRHVSPPPHPDLLPLSRGRRDDLGAYSHAAALLRAA